MTKLSSVHPVHNAPLAFARRAGCAISAAESDAHWQQAWDRHEADAVSTGREYSMVEVALRYWARVGSPPLAAGAVEPLVVAEGAAAGDPIGSLRACR